MRSARNKLPARPAQAKGPTGLEAAVKLAVQRHNAGDLEAAEKLYGHVLLAKPDHPQCLHNLAAIRLKRNDLKAAIDLLEAAVQADPHRSHFYCTLGAARQQAGDRHEALAAFRRAAELQPDNSQAWDGLGVSLRKTEQFDQALAAHRRALQLDPTSHAAARNLCNTLVELGQLDEAERLCAQLLDRNPLDAEAAIQRGMVRLARGDFSGWDEYAWGHWSSDWIKTDPPVLVPLPQWDGQTLQDQGLVLYGEQGIGDEIMFASFVPAAAKRVSQTTVLCEPRLVPLFARSFPQAQVAAKPAAGQSPLLTVEAARHLRCSLTHLPGRLGVSAADFTGEAYLRADPDVVQQWKQRLAALGDGLKIGISWRGGNTDATRATRSLSLQSFAPLFAVPGVRFVNVQYGNHADEIAAFNGNAAQPLVSFDDINPLRDMDGLAALLSALDLVISVDNSTVHLAGALGVPTWMLCPFNANWRWLQQVDTSPWYDCVRLFRQDASLRTAWEPVIDRITHRLQEQAGQAPARAAPATPVAIACTALPPALLAAAPTVMLINDTAHWYHWGCTGTSLALHEGLRAAGHVVDSLPIPVVNSLAPLPADADALDDDELFQRFAARHPVLIRRLQAVSEVVINGEGSIHGLGRTARALLYLAWIARSRLGKRTSIVNHSCFPSAGPGIDAVADALYARVYQALDYVAVREAHSAAQLARLGVTAVESFDCLPLFIEGHRPAQAARGRRVVLCGSVVQSPALIDLLSAVAGEARTRGCDIDVLVGASAFMAPDDVHLMGALHARLRGQYRFVAATSERQWLETIAGAQLLVSGRFHHSIAAACLGTPFAVSASNTSKIDGLIERLGIDRNAARISPEDVAGAVARVSALLQDPSPAVVPADRLAALRELSRRNFDGLVPPGRNNA